LLPFVLSILIVFSQKVFMNKFARVLRSSKKTLAVASGLGLMVMQAAHAQVVASNGITAALDAVDLSSISTKVGAAGLLIVGIALVFKGPALAKRIISKV
jgi:hypothetical protein